MASTRGIPSGAPTTGIHPMAMGDVDARYRTVRICDDPQGRLQGAMPARRLRGAAPRLRAGERRTLALLTKLRAQGKRPRQRFRSRSALRLAAKPVPPGP